jgi:hypothetical protein
VAAGGASPLTQFGLLLARPTLAVKGRLAYLSAAAEHLWCAGRTGAI